MNEISFVFYGEPEEVQSHMLFLLSVLEVRPAEGELAGFYAVEKKFGKDIHQKLNLEVGGGHEATLLYRYLSEDELNLVRDRSRNTRYYLLLHQMLDLDYAREKLFLDDRRFSLVATAAGSSRVRYFGGLKDSFGAKNLFLIKQVKSREAGSEIKEQRLPLPFFLLFLLKVIISPVTEVKRGLQILKFSNLRLLSRLAELIYFLGYVLNVLVLNQLVFLGIKIFYGLRFLGGLLKVGLIKLGFLARHLLLMSGFKSFGVFVDGFNFADRLWDAFLGFFFYKGLLPAYYACKTGINRLREAGERFTIFFYYRVIYFIYYRVLYAAYYGLIYRFIFGSLLKKFFYGLVYRRFFFFIYYDVGHRLCTRLYYGWLRAWAGVRHALLMTAFKAYGLAFDAATFSYRFTKLVLMYPFFKIYWFASFQYNKRVKKYL